MRPTEDNQCILFISQSNTEEYIGIGSLPLQNFNTVWAEGQLSISISDTALPLTSLKGLLYLQNVKVDALQETLIASLILLAFVVGACVYMWREQRSMQRVSPDTENALI